MSWMMITFDSSGSGQPTYEVEWFESRDVAEACALAALNEARTHNYAVTCFVAQCMKQGEHTEVKS